MANNSIVVEKILPAEPAVVFHAWSDADILASFMFPGELARAEAKLDFRVGGEFRIVMHGEQSYAQRGTYLEIDPPNRIVFSWVSEWLPADESETRVSISLEPHEGGRTRLTLVHDELPPTDAYDGHRKGWDDIATRLETILSS